VTGKYNLIIRASAAKELARSGNKSDRERLIAKIRALARDPRPPGCEKLSGERDLYRVRQGDYRIVYSILDRILTVEVIKIGHRKEVYR
jgi:mRNA interferase RelE/StbE